MSAHSIVYVRVCCHGNETRAPIANPAPCSSVGMRGKADTQTHTDGRDQYTFASAIPHAKCNELDENKCKLMKRVAPVATAAAIIDVECLLPPFCASVASAA